MLQTNVTEKIARLTKCLKNIAQKLQNQLQKKFAKNVAKKFAKNIA